MSKTTKPLTEGQRAYEAKRAAKVGMSLEKWLALKEKQTQQAAREAERARKEAEQKQTKKPNFFTRLLDRAHKPL